MTRPFFLSRLSLRFCSLTLLLGLNASVNASDSGVYEPNYEEIENDLNSLASQYPELGTKVIYGQSEKGKDLNLFRIAESNFAESPILPRKAVYISGATHGNENLHIADRLPRYLLENKERLPNFQRFLAVGGTLYIVPIFNPDAYEDKKRTNANGLDLNRDFPLRWKGHEGFTQAETRQFVDYLKKDLSENRLNLAMTLDYHCCASALLYPWSFAGERIPRRDFIAHSAIGEIMRSAMGPTYRHGANDDILRNTRLGTSKDYYYETFHSLSFTFEGKKGAEQFNFPKHVEMWESIFKHLNKG